ncbi:MAG TPA: CidA/LrgA family holin-like protein [Desulfobacteria bacterium]|nr:CidA/LrgA family holin-like protein [Desulfobacteria bacterium]
MKVITLKISKGLLQVALLCLISTLGDDLAAWLHLPIPGSIIGLFALFILLQTGIIHLSWVELGGTWLLAELLLFFVPSAVGVIQYSQLMQTSGLKLLIVIIASTTIVMLVSGLLTDLFVRLRKQLGAS